MEVVQTQRESESLPKPESTLATPEAPIKHPLENKWTLWFFENDKRRKWLDNLHEVYTFDTVEDFWCLFSHIRQVSDLPASNDYMLFKQGIHPSWEDEANKRGGRWVVNVEAKMKSQLNDMWLNTLLYMIGESFGDYSDDICGAFINIRKVDKIAIWTSDARKGDHIMGIGKKLKYDCLQLPENYKIHYEIHEDSANKNSSKAKFSYDC